jgi:hypothetical protein
MSVLSYSLLNSCFSPYLNLPLVLKEEKLGEKSGNGGKAEELIL